MAGFMETLREQRWDDHRFYHHSRINQSLHFISAISFLVAYGMLFYDPPMAALIAWIIGMLTRQSGHFFFEPKGYDHANQVTHEHKEEIKVGYNLFRKVILMAIWAFLPLLVVLDPTLMGLLEPYDGWTGFARHVGTIWLALGIAGVLFRMVQLFFIQDAKAGIVWVTKILTDPFHDIMLYHKAPMALMRGELIDPEIASHRPH
jgi:hypothetical protein